jgi:hypothetical protein
MGTNDVLMAYMRRAPSSSIGRRHRGIVSVQSGNSDGDDSCPGQTDTF